MQFFLSFSFCKLELLQKMKTHKNHTSPEMMKAFHMPRFSHHQSVLAMCNWRSLCSLSIRVISSFSLETICRRDLSITIGRKSLGGTPSHVSKATIQKGKNMQKTSLHAEENRDSRLVQYINLKDQLQYYNEKPCQKGMILSQYKRGTSDRTIYYTIHILYVLFKLEIAITATPLTEGVLPTIFPFDTYNEMEELGNRLYFQEHSYGNIYPSSYHLVSFQNSLQFWKSGGLTFVEIMHWKKTKISSAHSSQPISKRRNSISYSISKNNYT